MALPGVTMKKSLHNQVGIFSFLPK